MVVGWKPRKNGSPAFDVQVGKSVCTTKELLCPRERGRERDVRFFVMGCLNVRRPPLLHAAML